MHEISKLPYTLIPSSEKVDVRVFGIFIYQLAVAVIFSFGCLHHEEDDL
jgi:hypothetical protein